MTKKQGKERLLKALSWTKGDNLERAQLEFKHYSREQMELQHGQSGLTRQEVLESYIEDRKRHLELVEFVKSL